MENSMSFNCFLSLPEQSWKGGQQDWLFVLTVCHFFCVNMLLMTACFQHQTMVGGMYPGDYEQSEHDAPAMCDMLAILAGHVI